MGKIRVVVADDHTVLRAGLRMLINSRPDMQLVGEAADGRDAVRITGELRPDVLLLDLAMPVLGGVQAIAAIRERAPQTRILVLSMHHDPAYVRTAMAAGAHGYVTKRAVETELLAGIRAVHGGEAFFDSTLGQSAEAESTESVTLAGTQAAPLSHRERQVLHALAQGHSNQQIAGQLYLSVKTVETYRARLGRKLGLKTRADFVRYGLETGLHATAPADDAP